MTRGEKKKLINRLNRKKKLTKRTEPRKKLIKLIRIFIFLSGSIWFRFRNAETN
jgi:hypothetical protein